MPPSAQQFRTFPTLLGTRAAILKLSVAAEVPRINPSQLTWRKVFVNFRARVSTRNIDENSKHRRRSEKENTM